MKTLDTKKNPTLNPHSSSSFFSKSADESFFLSSNKTVPSLFRPATIQSKLVINQPGDKYEQEADMMADSVVQQIDSSKSNPVVQTKCIDCGQNEELQKSSMPGTNSAVRVDRKEINDGLQATKGQGAPLPADTRSSMESSFGFDFGQVKIHTNAHSTELNEKLQAKAFTSGTDVYFNQGEYSPNTTKGKRLLAHELTHVVQQNSNHQEAPSNVPNIQRACKPAGIGHPTGCTFSTSKVEMPKYLFKVNCNDFRSGNEALLREDAKKIGAGDIVEIHGFSSIDGDPDFNLNLSCARALKAKTVVFEELGKLGITADVRVFHHGGTGTAVDKEVQRSAVVTKRSPKKPPIPEPTEPDYNERVLIWLNAFIPGHVPGGTKSIPKGAFTGKTCIPAPLHYGCAVTDNRTFDKKKNAKTRMRLYILVNLKDLTFKFGGFSNLTYHVDRGSGKIICGKRSKGHYIVRGKIMSKNPNGLGMSFMGAGRNPCVTMSPAIDFVGMIGLDRKARRIRVSAFLDRFPAFEMYISSTKTFKTKTIFQEHPACNNSKNVRCLFGGPKVPANGDILF